jgi:hypothetical protein
MLTQVHSAITRSWSADIPVRLRMFSIAGL